MGQKRLLWLALMINKWASVKFKSTSFIDTLWNWSSINLMLLVVCFLVQKLPQSHDAIIIEPFFSGRSKRWIGLSRYICLTWHAENRYQNLYSRQEKGWKVRCLKWLYNVSSSDHAIIFRFLFLHNWTELANWAHCVWAFFVKKKHTHISMSRFQRSFY